MPRNRPLFSKSIADLEKMVESGRSDQKTLASVLAELKHRETDRAARLRRKIITLQQGGELDLASPERRPVPAQQDLPALAQQPAAQANSRVAGSAGNDEGSEFAAACVSQVDQERATFSSGGRPDPSLEQIPAVILEDSWASKADDVINVADPLVVERLLSLIDYIIAVEKDKLKVVTDVADHRAFHRTHDQMAGLPGVHFNTTDGGDAVWLKVERLAKAVPPLPEEPLLAAWIILSDDPTKEPRLRESLAASECRSLGLPIEEGQSSITLQEMPERLNIEQALEAYRSGPWRAWAEREIPRRETIALYGNLFAMQSILAAPDGTPQEFVCGIGYAALSRGAKRLRYPLLTVSLDIELDHKSHVISVVPREEVSPSIETDPLDALELNQIDIWRKDARRALDALDDFPLSPFQPETYDSILRQAAALLDPQASFKDGDGDCVLPPPVPGPELAITNAFGFFQRERRATQLMADLLAFKSLVESANGLIEIPGSIAAFFKDPSSEVQSEDFPTFRGINSIPGVTSSDGRGDDLFFPKPFNGEQVQIVQRLAVRDGVVVQGPPGTGKTHTIANIISHYLATGKRVLVTSQKSPALQVLQAQLPEAIRPLSVSLLDSDREGLRQFRASVDLIAERLQSLRKSELESEIETLESRIDGLHRNLAGIDNQIENLGRTALSPLVLDGQQMPPLDAALEVLNAGDAAFWIEDEISPSEVYNPTFNNDEIAAIRSARRQLGDWLGYLGKEVPPSTIFADVEEIVSIHKDLRAAAAITQDISTGALWPLASDTPEAVAKLSAAFDRLSGWILDRDKLNQATPPWDSILDELAASSDDPLLKALQALSDDARSLADDHAWFLTRPVDLPEGWQQDVRFNAVIQSLAAGGAGLGTVAGIFARKTKQLLSQVKLRGQAPEGAEDWQTVVRFIASIDLAERFAASWNHACQGTALPKVEPTGPAAGREPVKVIDRLEQLTVLNNEAVALSEEIRVIVPQWPGLLSRSSDPSPILECLRLHIDRTQLVRAETKRKSLLARLGNEDTPLHAEIRELLSLLGAEVLTEPQLRERAIALASKVEVLRDLQPQFAIVEAVSQKIRFSGAIEWAESLCKVVVKGEDGLCPGDWAQRWRLRRLATWLDSTQELNQFRRLQEERRLAEGDLSRTYTRLIEQKTWLALKRQASPAVMAALGAYAVAVGKIGRGTGKSANRHRKTARQAANAVKGALPCWIMPHHRVSESLPAELGLFDLVIVDEASQSTLSALPALFRARQILVVGDEKQVSPDHVGLAMDQANLRANRYLSSQVPLFIAPMREEASLYDLASVVFGGDNLMLREHFRCAAPIIEYSKRQFYRNELRPLRLSKASERLDPVLVDVRVIDGYRKGKTNPPEADFIVSELRRMGKDPSFDGRTFGVTTLLGTEQAALIYRRIESDLGIPFIEKYSVRVGDPAAFQGDERDVMFLSMVVTPGNATALSGTGYEQRFNVAASRARERMILVRSIDLEHLSPRDDLRRSLLEHFRSPFPIDEIDLGDARSRCESDFEREMFDLLANHGYHLDTQVKVGTHRIDIVVEGEDDRRLAIECDGDRYHGPEHWPADMARQRTLERAGWRIWRCFASRFVREREEVFAELSDLLKELDIHPRKAHERSRTYTELREWTSSALESRELEDIALTGELEESLQEL